MRLKFCTSFKVHIVNSCWIPSCIISFSICNSWFSVAKVRTEKTLPEALRVLWAQNPQFMGRWIPGNWVLWFWMTAAFILTFLSLPHPGCTLELALANYMKLDFIGMTAAGSGEVSHTRFFPVAKRLLLTSKCMAELL